MIQQPILWRKWNFQNDYKLCGKKYIHDELIYDKNLIQTPLLNVQFSEDCIFVSKSRNRNRKGLRFCNMMKDFDEFIEEKLAEETEYITRKARVAIKTTLLLSQKKELF